MEKKSKNTNKIGKERIIMISIAIAFVLLLAVGLFWFARISEGPAKKAVFKIGEETVYQDEVNLCILQNVIALGLGSEALEAVPADGGTAEEYYKDEILQVIMDYKVEAKVAEMRGISLSEEEMQSVKKDAVNYLDKINGRVLKQLGITQNMIVRVYRERYLAHLLEETVTQDIEIEEQRFCTVYMLLFPKVKTDEHGDYLTQEDGETPIMLSEQEIAQKKADADEAYTELMNGAEIEKIAEKYGVLSVSGEEHNLADNFGEPFSKYTKSLKKDEYSPVLDTSSCYAIIKMVNENDEKLAEQIYDLYQEDLKKEKVNENKLKWYEEAGINTEPEYIGNVWKKVSLYDFVQYVEE